jgi:hypothetical protein
MKKVNSGESWGKNESAAWIKPVIVSDEAVWPRDDSGGPDFRPYAAEFSDGGYITGEKEMDFGGTDDGDRGNHGDEDEPEKTTSGKKKG